MKSLLPVLISLVGFFILILIYYVFIYQKPETPFDVFLRLIRHNQETILAFTYKKTGPNEYLNYYINEDLELEPRVESFPVTFDSLPVQEQMYHGIISDTNNGFLVSGIEFPFRCPSGWIYENGKCKLEKICQESDVNVFKGISYYQFNEAFNRSSDRFHPRLYVDCNTTEIKNCAINELYVGGESLRNDYQPCEPYDLCQDMLTMTTHNFPIFVGDKLGPNQFYICQNGRSDLRTCPENTQFSRTQNGCIPVSRCFDREDNFTIYTGDPNQFVLCMNGQENVVRCGNGVFQGTERVECVNSVCNNPRILFQRFHNRINISIGKQFCTMGSNTPQQFLCNITTTVHKDNVQHLVNDTSEFPTRNEPHERFQEFEIPDTEFNIDTNACVPFNFDLDFIESGTHNDILPNVPINLKTLEITYSGSDTFYYKNYNKIMKHPDNIIIISDKKYANFTTIPDLTAMEYVDSVKTATGGSDGVNYLINGPMNKNLLSTNTIYENPSGVRGPDGLAWNVYKQSFTDEDSAHSLAARMVLGNDFSNTTYTFKYRIFNMQNIYNLHILTPYGYCTFIIELQEGVTLSGTTLNIGNFPPYELMEPTITGPNNTMAVTDIYDKRYNPQHRAYLLDFIKILSIKLPDDAKNTPISDFFDVDSEPLFKLDLLFTEI